MSDEQDLGDKIRKTFRNVGEEKQLPEPRRWRIDHETLVEIEVTHAGFGHTYLGDVDISGVTQSVAFKTRVGDVNHIVIEMVAMPASIRAMGVVEIIDKGLDQVLAEAASEPDETELPPHG